MYTEREDVLYDALIKECVSCAGRNEDKLWWDGLYVDRSTVNSLAFRLQSQGFHAKLATDGRLLVDWSNASITKCDAETVQHLTESHVSKYVFNEAIKKYNHILQLSLNTTAAGETSIAYSVSLSHRHGVAIAEKLKVLLTQYGFSVSVACSVNINTFTISW